MALRPRPTLKPWLPKVWRDRDTLQIGVCPTDGVLVSGVDAATASWLTGMDGSRSEAELLAAAAAAGLDIASAVRILTGLTASGVLLSSPIGTEEPLPELIQQTDSLGCLVQARQVLDDRRRCHIVIDGANRIGVPLGALLVASGIGRVSFLDSESVRRCDAAVGGLSLAEEGLPRVLAAHHAIRRVSSTPQAGGETTRPEADLLILCRPWTAHDSLQARGLSARIAHLAVAAREGAVVVGPLVLPGRTSCLRCAELHRVDRDLRWPAVAAQLLAAPTRAMHEPTAVLSALAAALAAGQALDHVDGAGVPDVVEATLEVHPPDWQLHRRLWPPHADCGCLESTGNGVRAAG